MNSILLKFLIFLLPICCIFSQEDKIVAKVGEYKIYESEFNERFDFSVHPKLLQKADTLEVKLEFLKELIAEKLLSLEAEENGLGQSEYLKNVLTPMQNLFVRDELYKKEIKEKIIISQKDIYEGLERIKKVLKLKFIFSEDKSEIEIIYSKLKNGSLFDSLLANRKEASDQNTLREVTFGTMEKEIEDEVYKLTPGNYTPPQKSKDGYYILKLIEVSENSKLKDRANTLEDVKRIVESRSEYKNYIDFYHNFFTKHKAVADKEIFESLIKSFVPAFKEKYLMRNQETVDNKLYLRGYELSKVLNDLSDNLKTKKFIDITTHPVKVDYFINQLSQEGFFVKDISEKSIRTSLSSYIRKFIEDELLVIEANDRGLSNSDEVKKYLNMWKSSYLSHMLMLQLLDSTTVNDEELYTIYTKNEWKDISPQKVNIVELLTDKLEIIEIVLKELSAGKELKQLAKQFTIRDSVKSKSGEFGLTPITKLGEIGKYVSQIAVGEIYGPVKLQDGYSIFQLIDRVSDTTTYNKSFDEVKDDLKKLVSLQRFEKFVNNYTAKLANKYGVEVNEDVVKRLDNSFINLVVVRYMGFGGEIFAVPYTEQYSGWYEVWQKNQQKIQ